jgi:hypothetical protein
MGLSNLLDPLRQVLEKPFGKDATFGDAILRLRHSYLVHGTFSPRNIEYLVAQTQMRDTSQQEHFAFLVWDLFHEVIVLRLKIIALVTESKISVEAAVLHYLTAVLKPNKEYLTSSVRR